MKTITSFDTITLAKAANVLTSNNTTPSDGDMVIIGTKVYTFKTTLGTLDGQIHINGSADAALLNLSNAINQSGIQGTDYYCLEADQNVSASATVTSHHITFTALYEGLAGNSIATTAVSSGSTLSWATSTLAGGNASATFTVADATFGVQAARQTVPEFLASNTAWSRAHQVSSAAYTIKRNGSNPVAIVLTALSKLGVALESSLSFAPVFSTQPANATAAGTAAATGTLTNNGTAPADGSTVVIGGKTYTWQTTLTNVDGHVLIGGSNTAAMTNLFKAITLASGAGTNYATATTASLYVTAANPTGTTVVITALVQGLAGNAIGTTQAGTSNGTWGHTTLTGGTDSTATFTVVIVSELTGTTYAWYESADGVNWGSPPTPLANGGIYSGATTASLTITPTDTTKNGYFYKCVATNGAGSTTSQSSSGVVGAQLTVD